MPHFSKSVHLLVDTWVVSNLAFVNNASVNIGVEVSTQVLAFSFFVSVPRRGIVPLLSCHILCVSKTESIKPVNSLVVA